MRGNAVKMVRAHLKGINTVSKTLADGRKVKYYYYRKTGVAIAGKPGTPEFVASYNEAAKANNRPKNNFASLIAGYVQSPDYQRLAVKTRKDYLRYIDDIRERFGNMPIEILSDPRVREHFFEWRDQYAATSRKADYAWSVLRRILSWAHNRGKIATNQAVNPGRLYDSDRSDKIWSSEDIDTFCNSAPEDMRVALLLALYTGQRQGDLLKMTWGDYDGKYITVRQAKTGKRVRVPVHRNLKPILDVQPKRSLFILSMKSGKQWKSDWFRHSWGKASKESGIQELHFHDLRGTAITKLSEAGCTPQEIASISGHSLEYIGNILSKYVSLTDKHAETGMEKWENSTKKK